MYFGPIEGKSRFTKAEMVAYARRQGFPTNEDQFDRWVNYGFLAKGQKRDRGYWSLPQMHLFLALLNQNQRPGVGPISLCTIPVWGWLYLGPEADIQVDQVERVMWSWQALQWKHPKDGLMQEVSRRMVQRISNPKTVGKRKLQRKMTAFAKTLEYPVPEERGLDDPAEDFFEALADVVDPERSGEYQGPQGAPLSGENLFSFYEVNRRAIRALLDKESLPRRYWQSARHMLLNGEVYYRRMQPQFARETEGRASSQLFQERTLNEMVNHVCYDLRLVLGCILNQPDLCEVWGQVETTSRLVVSPLLLPNGSRYSYLQIEGLSPDSR